MGYRVLVIPRKKRRILRSGSTPKTMKTPYGLHIVESCLTCPMMKDRLFCNLSTTTLGALDEISTSATYPKGAVLFVEGQAPRGVFVLCNGRVKLSANSADGKSLILRIADAGEVVGLPGTISGKPYSVTAEAIEPIQANFIPRDFFMSFLRKHGEAAVRVAEILSDIYHATYQELRYIALSGSAAEKLARFLLDLATSRGKAANGTIGYESVSLALTHEEIAEMIGASRETVTRLFSDFKRQQFIEIRGSTMIIRNRDGLEKLLST